MAEAKQNVYDRVTDKIIADLEKGVLPWQKPWSGDNLGFPAIPKRHTGESYRGVNILLLWGAAQEAGYRNPHWMTYKQAEEYGGQVRKGEKSTFVVFANTLNKTEKDEKTGQDVERQIPYMKSYNVFNAEQIDGLPEKFAYAPPPVFDNPNQRLEAVEQYIGNLKADIRHGGNRAYYAEGSDHIQMPPLESFRDSESYYATLLHETVHWTKHSSRLNRDTGRVTWGDEGYAKEECVAELGSAFQAAKLQIAPEVREDHAAYIGHWLTKLRNDKKFIFTAAADAGRAVDYQDSLQPHAALELAPPPLVLPPQGLQQRQSFNLSI